MRRWNASPSDRGWVWRRLVLLGLLPVVLTGLSVVTAAEEEQIKGVTQSVAPRHATDRIQGMEKRERASAPPSQIQRAAPYHEMVPNKPYPEVKKCREVPAATTVSRSNQLNQVNTLPDCRLPRHLRSTGVSLD